MSAAKKINLEEMQFLSLNDIAKRTTYHIKTIQRFAKEGRLKTVKINGRRLVTVAAFKEFLAAGLEEGHLEF